MKKKKTPCISTHIGICQDTHTKDIAGRLGKGEGDQKAPKIRGGYSGKKGVDSGHCPEGGG